MSKFADHLESLLTVLVNCAVSASLYAWVIMLALGAVHSTFPQVPALGFWVTLSALTLINLARGVISGTITGKEYV